MADVEPSLITTDEAGRLTNRSPNAIRRLVSGGYLQYAGFNDQRRPLLDRDKLLAWNRDHPTIPREPKPNRPWLNTLVAVRLLGPATTEELAAYLKLHPGNVRKHLRILTQARDVVRLSDGQWATAVSVARGDVRQDAAGSWYVDNDEVDEEARPETLESSSAGAA